MREVDFPALAGLSDWLGIKNFAFFFLTFLPGNCLTVMTNSWFYPKTHLEDTRTEDDFSLAYEIEMHGVWGKSKCHT